MANDKKRLFCEERVGLSSLSCVTALLLLSSCGVLPLSKSHSTKSSDDSVRREKLNTSVGVSDARQIGTPISTEEGFATSSPKTSIGEGKGDVGLPPNMRRSAMASKGLKVGDLFSETIRNDNDRFDRLESSVQDINDHLSSVSPSIDRLVAIEGDIQNLVTQLEVLLSEPAPSYQAKKADVSGRGAKAMIKTKSPSIKNNYPRGTFVAARGSENAGKTRVVFELSEKMAFSYDVDKDVDVLTLSFPDVLKTEASFSGLKRLRLVRDVSVTPQENKGVVVAISLSRDVSVVNKGVISPNKDNPMYRIYLDIK